MRTRFMTTLIFAMMTVPALSSVGLAQTGQAARRAKPKSNLPFDPHDLSGVWSRTGGDRGMSSRPGVNVPAMTPAGQKLFDASKPGYGPRAVPPATGNDIVGECNPQGVPRLLFFPRPVEFIQLPNRSIQFFQWHRVLRWHRRLEAFQYFTGFVLPFQGMRSNAEKAETLQEIFPERSIGK